MGLAIGGHHATVFDLMIAHHEMGVPLQDAKQRRTVSADFPNPQLALGDFAVLLVVKPSIRTQYGISQRQITLMALRSPPFELVAVPKIQL